jgi:enterochelin esterase-like enzyme
VTTNPLLALARTTGNPVIDEDGITLLWQGQSAPLLMDDFHHWQDDPQMLTRQGPGLWSFSFQLPEESYLEYAFIDKDTGMRLPDPFNPNLVDNGFKNLNNFFYMPPGKPTSLTQNKKGVHRGKVTRFQLSTAGLATGEKRVVHLYQPPVKEPVPLLVVMDGQDYLHRIKLNSIVDNLIDGKRIRPIGIAFVESSRESRILEYSCSESTLEFIFERVITLAQEHLFLTAPGIEPYGILGASLGGLSALYTGLRFPQVFSKVLCQSGAFDFSDFPGVIVDLARYVPSHGIQVWMDVGKFEWLLEDNTKMYQLLAEKQHDVKLHEYNGGHNTTCWANDIWRGLEIVFPRIKN